MENENSNVNISAAELRETLKNESGNVVIIDLMNKEDFAKRHIPGAINIPLNELENHVSEIPTDKTIVITCNRGLTKTEMGFQHLQNQGFTKLKKLSGGIFGWFENETSP